MKFRKQLFASLVSSFFIFSCAQSTGTSETKADAQSACKGFDVEFLKNGILGPDDSTRDRIQNSMEPAAYSGRFSYDDVKARATCEVANLIRGSLGDARKAMANMALGFAKKAALSFLDGSTFGIASAVFGGGSGPAGIDIRQIEQVVASVVNEAFDKDYQATYQADFRAFMSQYENMKFNNGHPPQFRDLAILFGKNKLEGNELERFKDQKIDLAKIRDLAIKLMSSKATKNFADGKPNFRIALTLQLVIGIYASVITDLRSIGNMDSPDVIQSYVIQLVEMEKELENHVEANISKPTCHEEYEKDENDEKKMKFTWMRCRYVKFGTIIDRLFAPNRLYAQNMIDNMRREDVRIEYDNRFATYFGATYDQFLFEMSKLTKIPMVPRRFCTATAVCYPQDNRLVFVDYNNDSAHDQILVYGFGDGDDQYFAGDWDGDGRDTLGVRRGNVLYLDNNNDPTADIIFHYGFGSQDDQYFFGDWDGDGKDNVGVRRGSQILLDTNFDATADIVFNYGFGNADDQYLVGDWDGDGRDNIGVRRGYQLFLDTDFDSNANIVFNYGFGNRDSQYFAGKWANDGKDHIGVRRGTELFLDTNNDPTADIIFKYGFPTDVQWLFGDFDGDGRDNPAVRRKN